MLIRREYAPARSPTSYSYGGGVWNGFASITFSNCSAFGLSPAASNFLESCCACRVNTSVHFTKEAPGSTYRPVSLGPEQSMLASSVLTEDKGFLVSLANHQRRSRPPYSFSTRCESVCGISPTQQAVSTASLFQQSPFSFVHSALSCVQDNRLLVYSQFALPPAKSQEFRQYYQMEMLKHANQRRLANAKPALAPWIGGVETRFCKI